MPERASSLRTIAASSAPCASLEAQISRASTVAGYLRPGMHQYPQRLPAGCGGKAIGRGQPVRISDRFGKPRLLLLRELVKHIQNPAAERLGYGRTGEHGEKVASAKGKPKTFYRERRIGVVGDFNHLRHVRREFVHMGTVDFCSLIFALKTKVFGKFHSTNPKGVLVSDRGKGDSLKVRAVVMVKPLRFFFIGPA